MRSIEVQPAERVFRRHRSVGLGEVDHTGALRLDGLARYVQDIAADDSDDAALGDTFGWVVRRFACRVTRWPRLGEPIELATFCGGTGRAWAQRRTRLSGAAGGSVDVDVTWICVDAAGRPKALPLRFAEIWGDAMGRGSASPRTTHPGPPADAASDSWPLRRADVDALGHVNNAAHWQAVVERVGDHQVIGAEMEFRAPLVRDASDLAVRSVSRGSLLEVWITSTAGIHSTARVWLG